MKTYGFGIVVFPTSWKLDFWSRDKKNILAIGPLRFVFYKVQSAWRT